MSAETSSEKLPVWRLAAGFGVLLVMAAMLVMIASVYADNLVLDRYVKTLAADPASAQLPDSALIARVTEKAHELGLPVEAGIVKVERPISNAQRPDNAAPRIAIGKYKVQTRFVAIDVHLREAASR